jgi:DMSO/TMAO reductase YedYZ molybdopterin-dependent catalytic subunit
VSKLWRPPARHLAEKLGLDRRSFLSSGLAAGAAVLTGAVAAGGCDSDGPEAAEGLLEASGRWNERVERALFRHDSMNVPSASARAAGARFPSYFVAEKLPVWNEARSGVWHLEVGGMVRRPLRLSLEDLKRLPRSEFRVEHFCVEGWTAVSVRTGVAMQELARRAEVSPDAQCVDFQSFDDDYHESWDLESALHRQTLIVYGQDGKLLEPPFGAPARVFSPIKLGYKNTKYLTRIMFLPARNGGYWTDQGYEWYGGV